MNNILVKLYYKIAQITIFSIIFFTNIFAFALQHNIINLNQKDIDYNLIKDESNNSILQLNEIEESIYKKHIKNRENNQLKLNKLSKYGLSLQEFVFNNGYQLNDEKIPIIIIFDEKISKEEKLVEIKSLFNNYNIIYEFDIIPGVNLECKGSELIELETLIQDSNKINKIFKDSIHTIFDSKKIQQNGLNSGEWNNWWLKSIGAENLTLDGTGINVSIIDTGIYPHPDLETRIIKQINFASEGNKTDKTDFIDRNGHGTHIAGIIGGDGGISLGKYQGIAPNVNFLNAKAGNSSGYFKDSDIIKAIEWSVDNDAHIISMSFGAPFPEVYDPITLAVTNATNQGILCVVSAGNNGPGYYSGGIPATSVNAIAVGSINKNGNISSFSSWGPTNTYLYYPSICAPGEKIVSTEAINSLISNEKRYLGEYINFPGPDDYYPLSGTSMACPMVSGALALLIQAFPNLTPEAVKIALLKSAYQPNNYEYLKFGAGIINISRSMEFLQNVNDTNGNVNNITTLYPNKVPIKPFDLLNYPGDNQIFNLTVLSGISKNLTFQVSDQISDIKIDLDKEKINFNSRGVEFISIYAELLLNATPGIEKVLINMSDETTGEIIDQIEIEIEKRIPEFKVLYESFHGLNDWFPAYSFKQIDFYKSMKEFSILNCSVKYFMDEWTPNYKSSINNSILTPEKLSLYDLVILQNPILPYSRLEIIALKEYFEAGGNILFLGTRYQEICMENINYLFNELNVGIQIREKNIENITQIGIGAILSSDDVKDFLGSSPIFNGVSKFYWSSGCTFNISVNGVSQAELYNSSVVASCDKSAEGKGRFLAFGDLYWLLDGYYDDIEYTLDHSTLLQNVIRFLLPEDKVSINLGINSEIIFLNSTSLSVFIKNQTTEMGIDNLINGINVNAAIENPVTNDISNITFLNLGDGVYHNDSLLLTNFSYQNYVINLSITIDSIIFNKSIKLIHPDKSKIPKIINYSIEYSSITREVGMNNKITIDLDKTTSDVTAYMGVHSNSIFNTRKTINKTLNFEEESSIKFSYTFNPSIEDTSGYAFFYVIPKVSESYSNQFSERLYFKIENNDPKINLTDSYYGSHIFFNDTVINESVILQDVFLLTNYIFNIKASEIVDYEENQENLRIFINIFVITTSTDGIPSPISPSDFIYVELDYNSDSKRFIGTFFIPEIMNYTSYSGKIQKSLASYNSYFGLFYITVQDSEGGFDTFIIIMTINDNRIDPSLIVIILIILGVIGTIIITMVALSRKPKKFDKTLESYYEDEYERFNNYKVDISLKKFKFCPYCGQKINNYDKFCKYCGRDIPEIL